ncbi:MAG TPA: hypothetical protein VND64_28855 [Pirellulales bacterium]|nr:hypothetical protein [Pirellulales bacterium]
MMSSFMDKRARDGRRAGRATLVLTALALVTWQYQASRAVQAQVAKTKNAPAVREGRLWNIADEPFKFRLARSHGALWTDELTLEPGEHHAIRALKPGEQSDLEGFTGRGDGYVNISFPSMGGHIHLHLPARNHRGELIPNWFHVKDANGFSRLIQAPDIDKAKAHQKELQQEEPLTEKEVERLKKVLRANWVFYDNSQGL